MIGSGFSIDKKTGFKVTIFWNINWNEQGEERSVSCLLMVTLDYKVATKQYEIKGEKNKLGWNLSVLIIVSVNLVIVKQWLWCW